MKTHASAAHVIHHKYITIVTLSWPLWRYKLFLQISLWLAFPYIIYFFNLCTDVAFHKDMAGSLQSAANLWVRLCYAPFTGSLLSSNANLTLKNNRCLLNCAHTSCCQWTRESDALECVLNRWFCPWDLPQQNRWLINANTGGRRQIWHMRRVSSGHCHLEMSHLLHPAFLFSYDFVFHNFMSY